MKKIKLNNIATNKKAYHDYTILDKIEAGIQLKGTEVKSIREGQINLKDSYIKIQNNEAFLFNCHISQYKYGGYINHEPERTRKLLLHKAEIKRLFRQVDIKGVTLIPLKLYFNDRGKIKLELGIAKGKQLHDKRRSLADKEAKREVDRLRKGNF